MRAPVGRGATVRRVLRLIRRLETGRCPALLVDLAREFGVTTRTIRRDLEVIESLGARVRCEASSDPRDGPSARVVGFAWMDADGWERRA